MTAAMLIGSFNILHPYMGFVSPLFQAKSTKTYDVALEKLLKEGLEGLNEKGRKASFTKLVEAKDQGKWEEYSNFNERCPIMAETIKRVDIACLQEISKDAIGKLVEETGYSIASEVYHSANSPEKEYGNAILVNPNKVIVVKSFEIKHGPEGSSRSAACAILEVSGKVYKVASIHLKGYWSEQPDVQKKQSSKETGYKELQTYVSGLVEEKTEADAIVIAGDFNEDPSEAKLPLYRPGLLLNNKFNYDGNLAPTEPTKGRRIDWIFIKNLRKDKSLILKSMKLEKNQPSASDHLMTGTIANWT